MPFFGLPDVVLGAPVFGVPSWSMFIIGILIVIVLHREITIRAIGIRAAIGWAALYAIAYWMRAVILGSGDFIIFLWMCLAVLGWVLWAWVEKVTPLNRYGLVSLLFYAGWVAAGFLGSSLDMIVESLNILVMIFLAVSYIVEGRHALRRKRGKF